MRGITGLVFLAGVILSLILIKFEFSYSIIAVIFSLIVGAVVFIVSSELVYSNIGKRDQDRYTRENVKKREKKANLIGVFLAIIFIVFSFNFYLYFRALMGHDLLISLDVENENILAKNGEQIEIDVKARVLTTPFCSANCSLSFRDLGSGKVLFHDNMITKVSSPFFTKYNLTIDEDKFGQKLYKITLECDTIKESFCYSNSPNSYSLNPYSKLRTKIISVDYELNDVQKVIKNSLKNQTEMLNTKFYVLQNRMSDMNFKSSYLDLSDLEKNHSSIQDSLYSLLLDVNEVNELYLNQEYSKLGTELYSVGQNLNNITLLVDKLNSSFIGNITSYNLLIENISLMYNETLFLEEEYFSNFSLDVAESFVNHFNSMLLEMKLKDKIEYKLEKFKEIEAEKINLSYILENESLNYEYKDKTLNISFLDFNLPKIIIKEGNYASSFKLGEPSPICCLSGDCYLCINNSSVNYPIILVHGHSFNEKLSAELSMEAFSDMARTFEKDRYLDAGYFYGSKYDEFSKGYLGKINTSVVVEATYYLDTLETEEDSFIFDSKWESIDTYASRLNEVVSNVKYLTEKEKVIIVAHSMGGLVTRRYIQLYGEDSLDKVIFIGVPNHGVDGFVLNYCSVFGADLECSEMNKSSSFLYELNSAPLPNIPIYNIIGIGCFWEGAIGDGIVKNESVYLEGAKNVYINGTCNGVDFFHVKMNNPSMYPEIYEIVKNSVKE